MIKRRSTGTLLALFGVLGLLWVVASVGVSRPGSVPELLVVHHSVQDGVHTYTGTLSSARCPLSVTVTSTGIETPHIQLALAEETGQPCTQPEVQEFSASVTAAAPILAEVTVDGKPIAVKLIEQ